MTSQPPPATVVLVHGAWHGAWCWAALQHALDDRGVPSLAIDLPGHGASTLPLGDLHGDAAHVGEVLDRLGGPVVLVGHSYGGAVITQAAAHRTDVTHLVYLAAFVPAVGESVIGLLRSMPEARTLLDAAVRPGPEGSTVLDPAAAAPALYGDCPPGAVSAALGRLSPQPVATVVQPVSGSPLGRIASTYVECLRDMAVDPSHQAIMAARCDRALQFDCDHSPFLSRTDDTAHLLFELARG
jgi:pimeloyl-ACP methyl ester carboxylesterase